VVFFIGHKGVEFVRAQLDVLVANRVGVDPNLVSLDDRRSDSGFGGREKFHKAGMVAIAIKHGLVIVFGFGLDFGAIPKARSFEDGVIGQNIREVVVHVAVRISDLVYFCAWRGERHDDGVHGDEENDDRRDNRGFVLREALEAIRKVRDRFGFESLIV